MSKQSPQFDTESRSHIAILSMPRSGSSYLASLLVAHGFETFAMSEALQISPSPFNPGGYFEDAFFTLLNDQLIRLYYGPKFSFLYVPSPNSVAPTGCSDAIRESEPEIPINFENNLEYFTGSRWDSWGITRMRPGGKWHRCYSKFSLDTLRGLQDAQKHFRRILQDSERRLVIKDPRLALLLHIVDPHQTLNLKVICLRRNRQSTVESMRRHYGPRLFTDQPYPNYAWVSNHFNYKIAPQTFGEFEHRYEQHLRRSRSGREAIDVQMESLVGGLTKALRDFVS